jgi:hypothetical protein
LVETLLGAGLACVIAAIVGGGLSAFGIVVPVFGSVPRQALLASLGVVLVLGGLRSDLWRPEPIPAPSPAPEPTQPKPSPTVNPVPPAAPPLASPTAFSDRVLKATAFYFGGRSGSLRVSDVEISCVSGRCEFGFTAATCAKEYIPTRDNGPIVSIVLADSDGKELTQIIRTTTAWVRNKDDYNRITHRLDDGWVTAAAWNKANRVIIVKAGWQERTRGACS